MKKSTPTINKAIELTVTIYGDKATYKVASQEALIDMLLDNIPLLKKMYSGRYVWLTSIKRGDGISIFPRDIYNKAYWTYYEKKRKQKENGKSKISKPYLKIKGYLYSMKYNDYLFEEWEEPRGKHVEKRGYFWYDEVGYRSVQKNWKHYRNNQYKESFF